jgi:hypothetical protein
MNARPNQSRSDSAQAAEAAARADDDVLPERANVLEELIAVIGADAAARLIAASGGTEIYVPSPVRLDGHWLVDLIGRDLAFALSHHLVIYKPRAGTGLDIFGRGLGAPLLLPVGAGMLAQRRRQRIREMTLAGESSSTIARMLGITTRAVTRYRQRLRLSGELR